MAFRNPFFREARVAVDLLSGLRHSDCVGGEYGIEDDDYNDNEHALAWEMCDVEQTIHPEVALELLQDHKRRQEHSDE